MIAKVKKLALAAMMLLLSSVAVRATTLSGTINYPSSSGLTGRIYFALSQQGAQLSTGSCGGPAVIVPTAKVSFTITSGTIQAGSAVVGNDCLAPAGTYYIVQVLDSQGNQLFQQNWQVTGSSEDIGTILPLIVPQGTASIGTAYITNLIVSGLCTVDGANCGTGATGPQGPAGPTGPAGTITVNSGATVGGTLTTKGPAPLIGIDYYGAVARSSFLTTTASTSGTNQTTVTLASAIDYVKGDGIVIWKAGASPSMSTPSAPTCTSPAVQGSRTIPYKIVAVDSMGGLTAASPACTISNAPTSMGDQPVMLTSLTQSSGTVSGVLSSPMPRLTSGLQISINGCTNTYVSLCGVFPVATSSDTSHFTYSVAGNLGAATFNAYGGWARITNTYNISSITRSGTTISITTNANHGYQVQNGGYTHYTRTIAVVQGVAQCNPNFGPTNDMNGEYVVLTASGTSLTLDTALSQTETGDVTGTVCQPTVTVYEYDLIICPQITGTGGTFPVAYYIYADYANSGSYKLIGKTLPGYPGQSVFYDYGPWQGGGYTTLYQPPNGYVAPAYVPTTPPGSAQNQLYVGTISNGAGTTTLTVTPAVPAMITSQTAMHDESSAFNSAITAAQAVGGGSVYIPPAAGSYVINAPIQFPLTGVQSVNVVQGGALIVNETINTTITQWTQAPGTSELTGQSFSRNSVVGISGLASPQIASLSGALALKGIGFTGSSSASQTSVYAAGNGVYGLDIDHCLFAGGQYSVGTSVPLVLGGISGITAEATIRDTEFIGFFSGMGNGFYNGGSTLNIGPNIPLLWIRGDDDQSNLPTVTMTGANTFAGRGVLLDGYYGQGPGGFILQYYEYQSPLTPTVMLYGTSNLGVISIAYGNNDSQPGPILANWAGAQSNIVTLDGVVTSGVQNLLTGSAVTSLKIVNSNAQSSPGQNINSDTQLWGFENLGSGAFTSTQHAIAQPMLITGPVNHPIGVAFQPVTGISASASGVGTFSAGSHQILISKVGWNGGESRLTSYNGGIGVAYVTTNGSQGITASWTADPTVKGYNFYVDNNRENGSPITTNSATYSSLINFSGASNLDGTGTTFMDANGTYSPLYMCGEKTAPSGVANADILYCDSTDHHWKMIDNNGAVADVIGGPVTSLQIPVGTATGRVSGSANFEFFYSSPTGDLCMGSIACFANGLQTNDTTGITVVSGNNNSTAGGVSLVGHGATLLTVTSTSGTNVATVFENTTVDGTVAASDGTFGSQQIGGPSACETSFGITTLSGASTTTGLSCLPANSIIDAVVYRITTTITTAVSFTIGDSGSATRYCGTQSTMTAGTTGVCTAQGYYLNSGALGVKVTPNTTPGAGAIRIIVYYHTWTAPTS